MVLQKCFKLAPNFERHSKNDIIPNIFLERPPTRTINLNLFNIIKIKLSFAIKYQLIKIQTNNKQTHTAVLYVLTCLKC